MKNLTTAIFSEATGSTFLSYIGSRFYKGRAPEGVTYPYAVFMVVTDTPELTFTEQYEHVVVQFSLFSISSSTTEIENMYTYLKAVYDDVVLTITDATCVITCRNYAAFLPEEHTTPTGTERVWAYHVEYTITESID